MHATNKEKTTKMHIVPLLRVGSLNTTYKESTVEHDTLQE